MEQERPRRAGIWPLAAAMLVVVAGVQAYYLFKSQQRIAELESHQRTFLKVEAGGGSKAGAEAGRGALGMAPLEPLFTGPEQTGLFEELQALREEADQAFNEAFLRFQSSSTFAPSSPAGPAVDVAEDSERYIVRVRPPEGVEPNLDVKFEEGLLKIQSKTEHSETETHAGMVRSEHAAAAYSKVITLPGPVDAQQMRTDWINGELVINIPKAG